MAIAVIADIIGSRRLPDRDAAQRTLDETIAAVERGLPAPVRGLRPTFADELQGEFSALADALAFLLMLQLALPDDVQCRFGIGIGSVGLVRSVSGDLPEGPAWWAAREAIDTVHDKQQRLVPTTRTWVGVAADEPASTRETAMLANTMLLSRDQLVAAMSERTRRLTYGRCRGETQRQLAEAEGITQSAVSQALAGAGAAAVIEGFRLLRQDASPASGGAA
ncbi:SatD family protein [Microbacterium sp. P01]|uniref:SatD family protein n=1 Tax=unclassified Microbacterium TaxID=2609290 RepID=UPI00367299C5